MSDVATERPLGRSRGWPFNQSLPARLLADGALILVILAWWLASRHLPDFVLPSPWATAKALGRFFVEPGLMLAAAATTARVVFSVIAATVIGIGLAIIVMGGLVIQFGR